MIEKFQAIQN